MSRAVYEICSELLAPNIQHIVISFQQWRYQVSKDDVYQNTQDAADHQQSIQAIQPAPNGPTVLYVDHPRSLGAVRAWLRHRCIQKVILHDPMLLNPLKTILPEHPYDYYAHVIHAHLNAVREISIQTHSQRAEQAAMNDAQIIGVPSHWAMHTLKKFYPQTDSKLASLPLAWSTQSDSQWSPSSINTTRDHQSFIFTGRFTNEKGLPILLQAWQTFIQLCPKATLHVIGGYPHRSKHHRRWRRKFEMNHTDLVTKTVRWSPWMSWQQTLHQLNHHAVCVAPSLSETFGYVALDALALGCRLITGRCGFAADMPKNPNLYVLPDSSEASLVTALQHCIVPPQNSAQHRHHQPPELEGYRWKKVKNEWCTYLDGIDRSPKNND